MPGRRASKGERERGGGGRRKPLGPETRLKWVVGGGWRIKPFQDISGKLPGEAVAFPRIFPYHERDVFHVMVIKYVF